MRSAILNNNTKMQIDIFLISNNIILIGHDFKTFDWIVTIVTYVSNNYVNNLAVVSFYSSE